MNGATSSLAALDDLRFDLDRAEPARGAIRPHHLRVHASVRAEIRRADLLRQRGEAGTDAWAAHRNLLRLKVAALLALLDGRMLVREDDWRLAGIVVDVSDAVRREAQAAIAALAIDRERQTSARYAGRAVEQTDAVDRHRVEKCRESIVAKVQREPGKWSRGALRAWMGAYRREAFGEALDDAIAGGWIEERGEAGQGEDRARLYPRKAVSGLRGVGGVGVSNPSLGGRVRPGHLIERRAYPARAQSDVPGQGLELPIPPTRPPSAEDDAGKIVPTPASDGAPPPDGAQCPSCGAGPFLTSGHYEKHWGSVHQRPKQPSTVDHPHGRHRDDSGEAVPPARHGPTTGVHPIGGADEQVTWTG